MQLTLQHNAVTLEIVTVSFYEISFQNFLVKRHANSFFFTVVQSAKRKYEDSPKENKNSKSPPPAKKKRGKTSLEIRTYSNLDEAEQRKG